MKIESQSSSVEIHCVSNPWREAIEGMTPKESYDATNVSNPWREAIEVNVSKKIHSDAHRFPILGGRLLKSYEPYSLSPKEECFQSLEGGY